MKKSVLGLLMIVSIGLHAQDCIDWTYYRNIMIDNTAGGDLIDYQIKVEMNTQQLVDEGKLQSNGADLRVLNADCEPLFFWGDSLGTSMSTDLWIKIPSIGAGEIETIQIYYGNETAESIIDGENTFILFDDFSSSEVDLSKWETVGGFQMFGIVDGMLNYASNGTNPGPRFKFARTVQSFSDEVIFDFNAKRGNSSAWGMSSADVTLDRILFRSSAFGFDTLNQVALMQDTLSNGVQAEGMYPILRFKVSVLNEVSMTAQVNDVNHLQVNRFANVTLNDENTTPYELEQIEMTGFHFIISNFNGPPAAILDNFRVRQSALVTPLTELDTEELVNFAVSVDKNNRPFEVSLFPNPSANYCWIQAAFNEQVFLEVIDMQGKRVLTEMLPSAQSENIRLDLTNLLNGTYFLNFISASNGFVIGTEKLIVAR